MGNIGDAIGDTAPAVSTSGPGYATTINSLLTELRARLIAKVPLSSLLTTSTFDVNSQAITNAAYLTLVNTGSAPGASPVNRITAFGGNLYWVGPSGVLQMTSGLSLNAAALGGITGDYSAAGPMQFRYDLANTRYDAFANQSTNTWAYVRARGFDIANSATGTNRARLLYGTASNLDFTLPAAHPAGTQVLTITSAGQIQTNGVLGANQSLTVSGTGTYKHGDKFFTWAPVAEWSSGSYATGFGGNVLNFVSASGGVNTVITTKGVGKGDRIKTISFYGTCGVGNSPTVVLRHQIRDATAVYAHSGSGDLQATGKITFTLNTPLTIENDDEYLLIQLTSQAGGTFTVWQATVTYDRP